jgi:hypothetical protein
LFRNHYVNYDALDLYPKNFRGKDWEAVQGLYYIVNHSDCDGSHTASQTKKIDKMFNYLKPALKYYDSDLQEWINHVAAFFEHAAKNNEKVYYG